MSNLAIIQARLNSNRFPNKTIQQIEGKYLIEILLLRLSKSQKIDKIVVATPKTEGFSPLVKIVESLNFEVFQGDEINVLDRYYQCANFFKPTNVIRITGDCPLVDAQIVDKIIDFKIRENVDYASNVHPPTFPDGLDTEVFSFSALKDAWLNATSDYEKEHVTPYIINNSNIKKFNYRNSEDLSKFRITVDETEDLLVIKDILKLKNYYDCNFKDLCELIKTHKQIFLKNKNLIRNEGAKMNTGQKLWKRAKKVIPGGNMLLSKRPEMLLPEEWPTYFKKASGCEVWDLDNKRYFDIGYMGVGTNILGYSNEEVDEEVKQVIINGNMSTLNCPEEVLLAEKLVELNPWSHMVRFARTGGEANSIAIRLARSASGKDKVAFCGYHGWHDWYLSANLSSKQGLDGHLIPGLEPKGVPRNLIGTVFPFNYNNFEELQDLVSREEIGTIKMEVFRNKEPDTDYLKKVRKLADERNIILIFDECTSGFRETYGGLHKKYDVEPDIAVFGKSIGNGYALTAVVGKDYIMQEAQNTFISSTFWTERIGPTAALKTLEIMNKKKSWEYITSTGKFIKKSWKKLSDKYDLKLNFFGLDALPGYTFDYDNANVYKTYVTQEMLKKGFLSTNIVYVCTEHSKDLIENYLFNLEPIFEQIKEYENGKNINAMLDGPVSHSGFKRLN